MLQNVNTPLHTQLREARQRAGLTQRELAQKAGISPNHLSEIEIGNRSASEKILTQMAEALGKSITLKNAKRCKQTTTSKSKLNS